jgi:MoxR-like ATPase
VRQGASVRGAIDLVLLAERLLELDEPGTEPPYRDVVFDAVLVALSGRIQLDETSDVTPEGVLREIWENHYLLRPRRAAPG